MPSVIITGADRGLGLSLCREYLSRGWIVFAGKFMDDYFFLENLREENPNLNILRIDMGAGESIKAAARKVSEILGEKSALDMIISNAALMENATDSEAPWRAFNVNALGPLRLTKAFLPLMSPCGGHKPCGAPCGGHLPCGGHQPCGAPCGGQKAGMRRLSFVSSEVACITLMKNRQPDTYAYPMSKAAMNMGVRLMFNELFPLGYTFRLFHPGWMKFREKDGRLTENGRFDPDTIGKIAAKYFETPLPDEHRLVMTDYNGCEWPF
ncbi:MAG: SDR family NAD(P)-dependent oxidoreductase [Defluviitaleaceae bacterium]|nr:SDR family NAD(P)-dependent oxidoreductase [Defluviitaleaceae bacterium]